MQNRMINKKFYVDKNLDYVTNLLKDRICLLEGQLIEKKLNHSFFRKASNVARR